MIAADALGQLLVDSRCQRVHTTGLARHEEKSSIGTHLMVIRKNIGSPFVKHPNAPLTFRMLNRQPVSVEVKPVMICTSTGPYLPILPIGRVRGQVCIFVHICPGRKTLHTIWVETRIQQDDCLLQ